MTEKKLYYFGILNIIVYVGLYLLISLVGNLTDVNEFIVFSLIMVVVFNIFTPYILAMLLEGNNIFQKYKLFVRLSSLVVIVDLIYIMTKIDSNLLNHLYLFIATIFILSLFNFLITKTANIETNNDQYGKDFINVMVMILYSISVVAMHFYFIVFLVQ